MLGGQIGDMVGGLTPENTGKKALGLLGSQWQFLQPHLVPDLPLPLVC